MDMHNWYRPGTGTARRTSVWRAAAALAALLCSLPPDAVRADPADTLRLRDAIAAAQEGSPMVRAARLAAVAAAARIAQAGALPDPELSIALVNRPLAGFGSEDPMTMNTVALTQRFPWPGQLGLPKERVRQLARADSLDAEETTRTLVMQVKESYFELAFMDRALRIMTGTRELLRNFLDVSSAMYGVGSGLQQDVFQAQIAVARMTEDIVTMEQNRTAMAARFNALLGRAMQDAVPALEPIPPPDSLPTVDSLMALAAAERPAIAAAAARIAAADAGYRAARRMLYPEVMLGLEYGQRPQFDDMASVMVGVSLPLWAGARQVPMQREMQAMRAMEEAEAQDLRNDTYAEIVELHAAAVRAQRLSELYATAILPQARAAVESALAAYRVGRVDYMTLVEDQMTVNRYEIETVRLAVDSRRAIARLESLVGRELGGTP